MSLLAAPWTRQVQYNLQAFVLAVSSAASLPQASAEVNLIGQTFPLTLSRTALPSPALLSLLRYLIFIAPTTM